MHLLLRTPLLLRLGDVMRVDACERHSEYSRVVHGLVAPQSLALSFGARSARRTRSDSLRVIAKIDPSVGKTALIQEIQPYAYVAGQAPLAAAKHSRHDEQMILVDEPGPDRVGGEGRTSHRNIERRLSLQLANHLRVEFPLEMRLRCKDGLQRFGIDDLVGRLPDPREVQHARGAARNDV